VLLEPILLPFWRNPGALTALRQYVRSAGIFRKAPISDLAFAKDLFDVSERVLDFGSDTGFELFRSQLTFVQIFSNAGAIGNEPRNAFASFLLISLLNPKITGIAEYPLFATTKRVCSGHDVVNVCLHGVDAVDQSKDVINDNVNRHPEVPLLSLLSLSHFRITLAAFILGGARCRNDGGIYDAALAQHQAIFLQMPVHFSEQDLSKTLIFEEMKKLGQGSLTRQTAQLQAGEA
jgi:hypothetical protein